MSILLIFIIIIIVGVCCAAIGGGGNSNNSNDSYVSNQVRRQVNNYDNTSNVKWKNCPECGHRINEVAKKCPYCNHEFSGYIPSKVTYTPTNSYTSTKYCPECGHRLNETAINCGFCGYSFNHGRISGGNNMETKHINKNGLSFDYPDYYDIGDYPSSDEAYQSIVALSKNDRACEIYVMKYRNHAFDNNAKRNMYLLKEYLKMKGYENITEHRSLPYCFNAYAYSEVGRVKTTILYNFDYPYVINIVGNTLSDYDCTEDLRIINNTI